MRRNFADIAFSQVHDPIGNAGNSHRIRSAKHLVLSDADNKRRALTSEDNLMGLIAADDCERIASAQFQNRLFHRRQQFTCDFFSCDVFMKDNAVRRMSPLSCI